VRPQLAAPFLILLLTVTVHAESADDLRRSRMNAESSQEEEIKKFLAACDTDGDAVISAKEIDALAKAIYAGIADIKDKEAAAAFEEKHAYVLRVVDFLAADQDDDNRVTRDELAEFFDRGAAIRLSDADLKRLRKDYDRWRARGLGHSKFRINCCGCDWFSSRSWEDTLVSLTEAVVRDRCEVLRSNVAGKAWLPFLCKAGRKLTYQSALRDDGKKWRYFCHRREVEASKGPDELDYTSSSNFWGPQWKGEVWLGRGYAIPKPRPEDIKPITIRFDCEKRDEKCVTPGLKMECVRYSFQFNKAKVSVWFSTDWPGLEVKRTYEYKPSKKVSRERIDSLVELVAGEDDG
jgi:hypothetical protein